MRIICFGVAAVLLVLSGGQVWAQGIDTPNPDLPPDGVYLTPDDVHAMYSGPDLLIVLSAIQHRPFVPGMIHDDGAGNEIEDFGSSLQGQGACEGLACDLLGIPAVFPVNMTGPVQTLVLGKSGNTTGTFQTEMVSMSLSGGGVTVRESPSLPSLGQTSITDIGGGLYHIDSFFDVFTELSLDGGASWIPSTGSARVVLGVPEPASVVLMGLALIGLAGLRRRRA